MDIKDQWKTAAEKAITSSFVEIEGLPTELQDIIALKKDHETVGFQDPEYKDTIYETYVPAAHFCGGIIDTTRYLAKGDFEKARITVDSYLSFSGIGNEDGRVDVVDRKLPEHHRMRKLFEAYRNLLELHQ